MRSGTFQNLGGFGKLLLLLLVVFASFIIFSFLTFVAVLPFSDFSLVSGEGTMSLEILRIFQIVQSFSTFILPALVAGFIFWGHYTRGIGFFRPAGMKIILSFLVIISLQPVVSYLGIWNSQMHLPDAFQGVEQWMKNSEESATDILFRFLDTDHTGLWMLNFLMIVLLPAFGEEMLFRGALQPIFQEWFRNKHVAVWITAFLFSAIHLQFFTFLPRFLLGLALGYLMLWGGNIWYPVAGHFANNSLSMIVFYYYRYSKPEMNPLEPGGEVLSPLWIIPGVVLTVSLFLSFYKRSSAKILP